jgi:hypothetical protein
MTAGDTLRLLYHNTNHSSKIDTHYKNVLVVTALFTANEQYIRQAE